MVTVGDFSFLSKQAGCIGVAGGPKEGEVLCSYPRAVEVYDANSHCCIRSWPLESSSELTCPAVYHPPSQQYCAITNKVELVRWTADSKWESVKLSTPAHSLLSPSHLPYILAVGLDGSISWFSENGPASCASVCGNKHGPTDSRGDSNTLVCWSSLGEMEGHTCLFVVHRSKCTCITACLLGDSGPKEMSDHKLDFEDLVSCCLSGSTLVLLGSSGTATLVRLKMADSTLHLLPPPIALTIPPSSLSTHTLPLPPSLPLLCSLGAQHFAVWEGRGIVGVWEHVHGTRQSRMECGHTNVSGLYSVDGALLCVVCGAGAGGLGDSGEGVGVLMCSVECGSTSLAAALGKRGGEAPPTRTLLVVPRWTTVDEACDAWGESVEGRDREVKVSLGALLGSSQTPSLQSFMAVLDRSPPLPGSPACGLVVRRILREKAFWASEALKKLIQDFSLSTEVLGEICLLALEKEDWSVIHTLLSKMEGLPSSVHVKLLQAVLQLPEKMEVECVVEGKTEKPSASREGLLCLLLMQPKDDSLLQPFLCQLPLSCVMSLLGYLGERLTFSSLVSPPPPPPHSPPLSSATVPTAILHYQSVVDWVSLLIDAHFAQLSLFPDAQALMLKLRRSIVDQVKFFTHLTVLEGLQWLRGSASFSHSGAGAGGSGGDWLYRVDRLSLDL